MLQLSKYRGKEARGCRLDRSDSRPTAAVLLAALGERPDILILNKFGKVEAEGAGLRDVLAMAVEMGVPIVVGVPFRNLDQWRVFAGDMAEECPVDFTRIRRWLTTRDILPAKAPEVVEGARAVVAE